MHHSVSAYLLPQTPEISALHSKELLWDSLMGEFLIGTKVFKLARSKTLSSGTVMKVLAPSYPIISRILA